MKKKYLKPEVCLIGHGKGSLISTSGRFAERSARMIDLLEKEEAFKEESVDAGKISRQS